MVRSRPRAGFSLLEIVIVLVILGVIAAIAIPRMSSAASNSANAAVAASVSQVQKATELYAAEHLERDPSQDPDGSVNTDGAVFARRLVQHTDDQGNLDPTGIYGPYLRSWPTNQLNRLSSLRIGGPAAGANTDGWRFDPPTRKFESDYSASKVGVSGGATGLGGGALVDPSDPGGGAAVSPGP